MARVSGVLLDHVQEHVADRGGTTVRPGQGRRSVKTTLLDHLRHELPRPFGGALPQRVDLPLEGPVNPCAIPTPDQRRNPRRPTESVLLAGET